MFMFAGCARPAPGLDQAHSVRRSSRSQRRYGNAAARDLGETAVGDRGGLHGEEEAEQGGEIDLRQAFVGDRGGLHGDEEAEQGGEAGIDHDGRKRHRQKPLRQTPRRQKLTRSLGLFSLGVFVFGASFSGSFVRAPSTASRCCKPCRTTLRRGHLTRRRNRK